MAKNPISVKDYYNRQPTPDKLQKNVFRYTHNSSQKERVMEQSQNYSYFESEPLDLYKKGFLLRQREPEKELGQSFMKFKPSTTVERVFDSVNKSVVSTARELTMKFHSQNNSPVRDASRFFQQKNIKVSPKAILLPELHHRTHFKAATSILMQHQGTLHLDNEELNRQFLANSKQDDYMMVTQTNDSMKRAQRNINRHSSIDNSLTQNSQDYIKNILLDCKVLREKNGNVAHQKPFRVSQMDTSYYQQSQIEKEKDPLNMMDN
ncbi:UNKNOWN [Stylonychia lemnae]|uniref:Uncharacterized protein n=1 Tax=Stylonychia lemnae TaxID=5949 RepID=A0A078BD17_STYLE|nr:UNKNOWN [Stylonychia lemnae]|eukprot:CDW91493.1 UNKNOWN [Stylonychia lemnae]